MTAPNTTELTTKQIITWLESLKAKDITCLDIQPASFSDYFIICTANSSVHARAIAERIRRNAKGSSLPVLSTEGETRGDWVVLDMGDIIVHIMQQAPREFYRLEAHWTS